MRDRSDLDVCASSNGNALSSASPATELLHVMNPAAGSIYCQFAFFE
jgi:hypothetical protein